MIEVLFEDAHCLAVSKPAGLLTQGRVGGERALEDEVRLHLSPDRPGSSYLGTVHRLDRPVSGVVLWAKTPKAARRLAEQFADRTAKKEYWAVVAGEPSSPADRWEDWLCEEDTGLGVVQVCRAGTPRARRAVTDVRVAEAARLAAQGLAALVLHPETGRTHQLRVQAGSRGLPIVGDAAYGSRMAFPGGIALHARSLTIRHPTLDREITFAAEPPPSWEGAGFLFAAPGGGDRPAGGPRERPR